MSKGKSKISVFPNRIVGLPEVVFRWIFIVFFAIVFPVIFLEQHVPSLSYWLVFSLPFGLFYSAFLVHLVLFLSKKFKSRMTSIDEVQFQKILRTQLLSQAVVTTLFATCMGIILSIVDKERFFSVGLVARNITGSLLVVGILLGIYDGLYWINQLRRSLSEQEKLRRMNVQGQLDVLRNQVKPHFLFNSLNTLVGIIPEDPDLSIVFVEKLSKVYRYILEIRDRSLISLEEEVTCIRAYLFLLEIRFGDNLRVSIRLDELSHEHHVIPLCLQLLVENAVKHNIVSKAKPLTIEIELKNDFIEVKNNLQPKSQKMTGTGTGLSNIIERYELLLGREVRITKSQDQFRVSVPIIKVKGA